MGTKLKNIKASFVGSHPNSHKIPQWIKANNGSWSREVNETVTHLIATESAVIENVDAVQKARALKIKIVSYDWLEDSLLSKAPKPKPENAYLWDQVLRKRKTSKVVKNKTTSRKQLTQPKSKPLHLDEILEEFSKDAHVLVHGDQKVKLHLYVDETTGISYSAKLTRRVSNLNLQPATEEKLHIGHEPTSHNLLIILGLRIQTRHTYSVLMKFTYDDGVLVKKQVARPRTGGFDALLTTNVDLDCALVTFKKFFLIKTGLAWNKRSAQLKNVFDIKGEGPTLAGIPLEGWFRYERPSGLMDALKLDAEIALEEKTKSTRSIAEDDGIAEHGTLYTANDACVSEKKKNNLTPEQPMI